MTGNLLDKQAILAHRDLPLEEVHVPEWGGVIYVRTLTATERDAFEASNVRVTKGKAEPHLANLRARFCVLVICDHLGSRIFADADAAELGRKSSKVLDRIVEVGKRLNGFGTDDLEEARGN